MTTKLNNHLIEYFAYYVYGALLIVFVMATTHGGKPRVVVVDGCQYVKSANAIVHKANCPNH